MVNAGIAGRRMRNIICRTETGTDMAVPAAFIPSLGQLKIVHESVISSFPLIY